MSQHQNANNVQQKLSMLQSMEGESGMGADVAGSANGMQFQIGSSSSKDGPMQQSSEPNTVKLSKIIACEIKVIK